MSTVDRSGWPPVEKQMEDMRRLLVVTRAMSAEKDHRRLLALIMEETTKVMAADRSSLFLYDRERDELYTEIAQKSVPIRVPCGKGVVGSVARGLKTLHIPDVDADERFNGETDRQTGFRTRNILCSPMCSYDGRLIGVLEVLNKQGGDFSDYDITVLEALASQAAVVLDNARLVTEYVKKQRMEEALSLAREIQGSLFPRRSPELPHLEVAGWAQSCDQIGGDYYDFIELGDGRLAVVVADVTGHGVGPALVMSGTRAYLRAALELAHDLSGVMSALNRRLCEDLTQGRFVTMFLAVLDGRTGRVQYASAGHGYPVLLRSDGTIKELESTGPPLGMMESATFPEGEVISVGPGETLLATTDGIEEALNDRDESFGRQRLHAVLRSLSGKTAHDVVGGFTDEMRRFSGKVPRQDDWTVVAVVGK